MAKLKADLKKDGLKGIIDSYGRTAAPSGKYNPRQGPKTWAGSFFTLLSYGVVGALYYLYVTQFINPDNTSKVQSR